MKFARLAAAALSLGVLATACGDGTTGPLVVDGPAAAPAAPGAYAAPAPAVTGEPQRVGQWQLDASTGRWVHDSGVLHLDPTGNGVLYETVYGYVADFNSGLVFDPFVQQWVNPFTYYTQSGGGSGWSYSSIFGYGASDGTSTGFSFGNGCTVLDGSVLC